MERLARSGEALRAIASKRRWSWDDAQVVLKALDESGGTVSAFCRDTGLTYFRVLQWNQKRQQARSARKEQPIFLPLRVIEETNAQRKDSSERSGWVVQIELSDCLIRVAEGASEAIVTRAVRAARERSC